MQCFHVQLFLLTVNSQYGYVIDTNSLIWRIYSFVQLNAFVMSRGYTFFLAMLYVSSEAASDITVGRKCQ